MGSFLVHVSLCLLAAAAAALPDLDAADEVGCRPLVDDNAVTVHSGEEANEVDVDALFAAAAVTPQRAAEAGGAAVGGRVTKVCRRNFTYTDGAASRTFTCVDHDLWDLEDTCKQNHLYGAGDTFGRTTLGSLYLSLVPAASTGLAILGGVPFAAESMHLNFSWFDPNSWAAVNTLGIDPASVLGTTL